MSRNALVLGVAALASLTGPGRGGTDTAGTPISPAVQLEFAVLTTGAPETLTEAWAGATRGAASFTTGPLTPGQSQGPVYLELHLGKGTPDSPCGTRVSMGFSPPEPEREDPPPFIWSVQGSVQSVATDRIEGRYSWRRHRPQGDGPEAPAGTGAFVLREDDRVLLDFIRLDPSNAACYRNLALELRPKRVEPEPPMRLSYDLWLVGDGPEGRTTRHLRLAGNGGEQVRFDYGRLWVATPAGLLKHTAVTGQIRGRLASDGTVDLAFLAERQVVGEHWAVFAQGHKQVKTALGETLRLDLPPPGVGGLEEAAREAMRRQRVSLVLTVDRLD